jgi:cell division protein FtsI (penicillin-binding protein 3)
MEVKTGEIRAIANLRYDPKDGKYKEIYNYAIGDAVEPGSTFKLASVIAALETGRVTVDDQFFVGEGRTRYHNREMVDVHRPEASHISVREIFEESSNVGVSKMITTLFGDNPSEYTDQLRKMSLGKPLGIEIPGEGKPYIKDPSDKRYWYGTSLPWMSIGYELTLTPLQVLTLYNAVANDGVMVKPQFVSEIREGGQTIRKFEPEVLNPAICSKKTVEAAQSLLEGVVTNGTGKVLKDSAYRIAGKTGTALVADGNKGYGEKKYNASFAGYFPADNPKYSCIIVVNRPQSGKIYGGAVAAPVFKDIADKVYATQIDIHDQNQQRKATGPVLPASGTGHYESIRNILMTMAYPVTLPKGSPEWAQADSLERQMSLTAIPFGPDTIPDLTGLTAKDAVYLLEKAGIAPVIQGKGTVTAQSLPAGTPMFPGSEILLTLENLAP